MSFYLSREWLELRYKAFQVHGRKCLCCNATDKKLHVDHIKPVSKYPELKLELSNLQVLCEDCNLGKSNIDETDFRIYKVPETIKLPPGSYCWVKFNSKTVHRWVGSDTLCGGIRSNKLILASLKETSIKKPQGKICSDCKRVIFSKSRLVNQATKPVQIKQKVILRKKKDLITEQDKRLFNP